MNKQLTFTVSPYIFIYLSFLFLLFPIQWVGAFALAVIIHEGFHMIAIHLLKGKILSIHIGSSGMIMETSGLSGYREAISACMGPIGSILIIFLGKWLPRTAACGVIHCIFNLIPLFPLDGGRILRGTLYAILKPPKANKIFLISQRVIIVVIICFSLFFVMKIGVFPIIFALFLICKVKREKLLANRDFWRYNKITMDKEVTS